MFIAVTFLREKRFTIGQSVYRCQHVKIDQDGVWVNHELVDRMTTISKIGLFTIKTKYIQQVSAQNINLNFQKNITRLNLHQQCNVSVSGDVSSLKTTNGGFVTCNTADVVKTKSANIMNSHSSSSISDNSNFLRQSAHQITFTGDIHDVSASNCNITIDGSVFTIDGDKPSISISGNVSLIDMDQNDSILQQSVVAAKYINVARSTSGHIVLHRAESATSTYGVVKIVNGRCGNAGAIWPKDEDEAEENDAEEVEGNQLKSLKRSREEYSESQRPEREHQVIPSEVGFDNLKCDALFSDETTDVTFNYEILKALFGPLDVEPHEQIDVTSIIRGCTQIHCNGNLSEFFGFPFQDKYCHLQVWYTADT